ncbi:MAG: formylglycine-generating enzyme family protein [Fibrobacter sp.]|nr:formylglycine-generating enzyme family protein [Fibrobacter sp.]
MQYDINGKVLNKYRCESHENCKHLAQKHQKPGSYWLVNQASSQRTAQRSVKVLDANAVSIDTISIAVSDSVLWLELEKNQVHSLCLEDSSGGLWEPPDLAYRFENARCIQFHTGDLVKSAQIKYSSTLQSKLTVNLLIGMKYIDLSAKPQWLGSNNIVKYKKPLIYYLGEGAEQKNLDNMIFIDPERWESVNEVLAVDKYLVTQCEILRTLGDSIPEQLQKPAISDYYQYWMDKKKKLAQKSVCETHDSANVFLYKYAMVLYANLRSVRDGFEPVYNFEYTLSLPTFEEVRKHSKPICESVYLYEGVRSPTAEEERYVDSIGSFYTNAAVFDNKVSNLLAKVTINKEANGYRLPYYNEWMALARGGEQISNNYWEQIASEDTGHQASAYAWFGEKEPWRRESKPVGVLKPNNYGLYDMLGLVDEVIMLNGTELLYNYSILTSFQELFAKKSLYILS